MAILADHQQTEQITDEELKDLRSILRLIRHKRQWISGFMDSLARIGNDQAHEPDPESIVDGMIQSWYHDPTNTAEHNGVLYCVGARGNYVEIHEEEYQSLRNCLAVLRDPDDTWLKRFIDIEFERFAEGKRDTPADVVQHIICGDMDEFNNRLWTAGAMLRNYRPLLEADPELAGVFAKPEPPKAPAQPKASAESEPTFEDLIDGLVAYFAKREEPIGRIAREVLRAKSADEADRAREFMAPIGKILIQSQEQPGERLPSGAYAYNLTDEQQKEIARLVKKLDRDARRKPAKARKARKNAA